MKHPLIAIVTVMLLGAAASAAAQPAPAVPRPATPAQVSVTPWDITREVGVTLGIWNFMDEPSSVGGRYTRRYREWLAGEVSVDVRRGSPSVPGDSGLAIAGARFMARDRVMARDWFVTVGVAAASGLSFRVSPVVGAGVRWHVEDVVSLRLEVQRFPRGRRPFEDTGRLLLSVAVGIR